jgi:hypothetical protein
MICRWRLPPADEKNFVDTGQVDQAVRKFQTFLEQQAERQ